MPHARCLVLQDGSRWLIGRMTDNGPDVHTLDVAPDATEDWAVEAARKLHALGYSGEGIVLGIASRHCLSRTMMIEHATLARDRQALAYAFEAWFPLAAEDLAMDFVVDGRDVLGAAVETAVVAPFVAALEDRGVAVQAICPIAVLALQHHLATRPKWGKHIVVWGNGDQVDLWLVDGGQPRQWRLKHMDPQAIVRELEVMTFTENRAQAPGEPAAACESQRMKLAVYEIPDELRQLLSQLPAFDLAEVGSLTRTNAAAMAVDEILTGKRAPLLDFRRGALAAQDPYRPVRRAIRFTMSAAVVCTVLFVTSFFVRAERFERETRRHQSEQTHLFQQCLPDQEVPVGIRSRLESEYSRLAGLTGTSTPLPVAVDSLATLYDLLASLPMDLPYRLMELRIDNGRVYMDLEVSSHGDADRIASALGQGGFDVEPPHSQQLANGSISLRMEAVPLTSRNPQQPETRISNLQR